MSDVLRHVRTWLLPCALSLSLRACTLLLAHDITTTRPLYRPFTTLHDLSRRIGHRALAMLAFASRIPTFFALLPVVPLYPPCSLHHCRFQHPLGCHWPPLACSLSLRYPVPQAGYPVVAYPPRLEPPLPPFVVVLLYHRLFCAPCSFESVLRTPASRFSPPYLCIRAKVQRLL
ncbi:hypothetical protein C8Q79DRAFT_486362 [Trametes meyenii]|nr:hypothetical protein C8Q79DRAFT_486362 [Trametes meyenii]